MTAQEAINRINFCKPPEAMWGKAHEAFEVAIEALEKQIPKKCEIYTAIQPRMTYDDEVDVYECPNCGTHIGVADENNQYSYCWDCGQKLDWGE